MKNAKRMLTHWVCVLLFVSSFRSFVRSFVPHPPGSCDWGRNAEPVCMCVCVCWLSSAEAQIREKAQRQEREAADKRAREQREEMEAQSYNPWGRPGAGAPMRDSEGHAIANLKEAHKVCIFSPPF